MNQKELEKDYSTLLGGKVQLAQPVKGFRASIDGVFAAAAIPAKKDDLILDMGCGVGAISLCMAQRCPEAYVTGIELQESYYELALENACLNEVTDRVQFFNEDIQSYKGRNFDIAVSNPPYMDQGSYTTSPDPTKEKAIGETSVNVWVDMAAKCLKPEGTFVMIHRSDYLQKIIQAMGTKFGAIEIFPLHSKAGEPAKRMIIRARKGRKTPSILYAGIIVHDQAGAYTEAAEKVLRGGAALF